MFENINTGNFILLHTLKDLANDPYCIMYVKFVKESGFPCINGIILKTNIPKLLFIVKSHYYDDPYIIKKITNNKQIEELSLIYKIYLLQES